MAMSIYDIVRVDEGSSLIRVLELHPGHPEGPFTGRLVVCSLDDEARIPYTALSYTWGPPEPGDTTIQLQGYTAPVPVGPNLRHALKTLRRPDAVVRLWIDAICINQSDPHDKAPQVMLMGRIYSLASKTVIWLNPASEDSVLGMESVRAIGDKRRMLGATPSQAWLEAAFTLTHWAAIGSLMASPWWGRIWIVQEVLLSRNPHVHCGKATTLFDDFVALEEVRYTHIRTLEGLRQIPRYAMSVMMSSWSVNVNDARSNSKCPLFDWLQETERFAFTVPRDRFYALRDLSSPAARQAIPVDYDETQLSDAKINGRVAVHCLQQFRILQPLQFPYHEDRTPGLPSWCPDWYRADNGYQSFAFDGQQGCLGYQACGPDHKHTFMDYNWLSLINDTDADCPLWFRGWPFDAIEYHDAYPIFDLAQETTPALQAAGRAARRRALHEKFGTWQAVVEGRLAGGQPNPYGTAAELRAAFWRTLIADRDHKWAGPPPEDFGQGLAQFLAGDADGDGAPPLPYLVAAAGRLARRAFVVTSRGYLGLAPGHTVLGDGVCVLEGGNVPFVLRRANGETPTSRYTWVGEAYVHGIMQGEWVAELEMQQGQRPEMANFVVI